MKYGIILNAFSALKYIKISVTILLYASYCRDLFGLFLKFKANS
jgi:hypothetical protein